MNINGIMQRIKEVILFLFLAIFSKAATTAKHHYARPSSSQESTTASFCLSWRLAVEANNMRSWRTVPTQCSRYVESYMIGGQYDKDVELIVDQIMSYIDEIVVSGDGMDAWILDIDDTCISNIYYYKAKRYGYVYIRTYIFPKNLSCQVTLYIGLKKKNPNLKPKIKLLLLLFHN